MFFMVGLNPNAWIRAKAEKAGNKHPLLRFFIFFAIGFYELAKGIYDGARKRCGHASYFETQDELLEKIAGHIHNGDTVLVKASRGMKLEKTVEYLLR